MTEKSQKKNGAAKKTEEGFLPFDFFEAGEPQIRKKKKTGRDIIPDLFSSLGFEEKVEKTAPEIEKENSAFIKEEEVLEKAAESDIILELSEENDETARNSKIGEKVENDEIFPEDDIKFEISYSEAENTNDKNTENLMADNEIKSTGEDIPGLENTDELKAQTPVPEEKSETPETLKNVTEAKTPGTRVPLVQRPVVKEVFSVKNKNASPGEILQEGRVHSGLSINQVEQITKIRLSYLESIEHDDFPKLPPVVYVTAYIKTLCSLYNISAEDTALVLSNLKKSGEKPVTEDILKHLESEKHVNIQEEAKSKRLIMKSAIIMALVIVWIGILALIIYKSGFIKKFRSSGKTVAVKTEKPKNSKPVISIKTVREAEEKTREATAVAAKEKTREAKETAAAATKEKAKNTAGPQEATREIKPKDSKEAPAVQFSGAELEKFVPPQNISLSELALDPEKAKK